MLVLTALGRPLSRPHAVLLGPPRGTFVKMTSEDDDALASEFTREWQSRQQQDSFRGIREVVLDAEGNAKAIPRRPPPQTSTQRDEISALFQSPQFLLGVAFSLGSLLLLLAIAQADAAASG